jgi:hypothetical protein
LFGNPLLKPALGCLGLPTLEAGPEMVPSQSRHDLLACHKAISWSDGSMLKLCCSFWIFWISHQGKTARPWPRNYKRHPETSGNIRKPCHRVDLVCICSYLFIIDR